MWYYPCLLPVFASSCAHANSKPIKIQQYPMYSKVVASDNLTHSKECQMAAWWYPSNCKSVSIWSDGPSSQFKNHYIAVSLHALKKQRIKIILNIYAISHMMDSVVLSNVMCGQEGHCECCSIICSGLQCTWINRLSKDASATGTGSDEEAFDITVKDRCVGIYDYDGEW